MRTRIRTRLYRRWGARTRGIADFLGERAYLNDCPRRLPDFYSARGLQSAGASQAYPNIGIVIVREPSVPGEKPLFWVGSSKRDLVAMPKAVVRHVGMALSAAQYGGKHPDAKSWKGLGSGVLEVVSNYRTNTFRAAYVVRFRRAVYVLHCFQKKSTSGRATVRPDVELLARRLKAAQADYEARYGQEH
jgi:phage-related protein